jgi:hypothetical protein
MEVDMVNKENFTKVLENNAIAWYDVNNEVRFYVLKNKRFALVNILTNDVISLDKPSLENLIKILMC